jgi:hypothetical protein
MYKYKHVNGQIINKVDIIVEMAGGPSIYFEGDLVQAWWHINDQGQIDRAFPRPKITLQDELDYIQGLK